MGFGRFGVGGCCLCSPENPGDPGGSSERAGPCGWCGLYDPNEIDLDMPVPPSKLCEQFVFDDFSYSKDYPRVPYWTWQRDQPGADWNEKWLYGDYHHLNNGHFVNSGRGRYSRSMAAPWRPITGKYADNFCKFNIADGNLWEPYPTSYLTNLPPFYGNNGGYSYDYPYRYKNGILVNSQSNKTDLIPLKQNLSLSFNTPRNQFPRWFWNYDDIGSPFYFCLEPPCSYTTYVATQSAWLASPYMPCTDYGQGATSHFFQWNYPGFPNGNGYGLFVTEFSVKSQMKITLAEQVNGLISTAPYIPNFQDVAISYRIGEYGSRVAREGEGSAYFPIPYKDSFNLKVEVQFNNWPSDNRKCLLTVNFLIDGAIVFTKQHIIAKPGWRQDGSPSDEQAYIQSFCPGQIYAWNEISGVNFGTASVGPSPWFYERIAYWDADQTPRESFYLDNWWAEYARLNP